MSLDLRAIRSLNDLSDPSGVLSFYVGHTPGQAADRQPTAPIELRNQLRELTSRLAGNDPARAKAVDRRLAAVTAQIDALLDPKTGGRGRALFVAVDSGETVLLTLQIPFRERVVLHDSAYVRPLIAAYDEGREAGILVVSRAGARLLSWSVGEVEELWVRPFELSDAQLARQKSGPAPSAPQHPHHSFVNRERFEDRVDVNHHRFLREIGENAVAEASERGWDRLVLSGPPKVRDTAKELIPPGNGLHVLLADQAWEDASPHGIAEQVWPLLRSVHRARERALVDAALERSFAGGPGAVGLRNVCAALNAGRVEHLLYDDGLTLEGFRSEEGTLHPRVEGVVAASDLIFHREPLFIERMIEKALETGAAVTPLGPEASGGLADHEGVAALLRW